MPRGQQADQRIAKDQRNQTAGFGFQIEAGILDKGVVGKMIAQLGIISGAQNGIQHQGGENDCPDDQIVGDRVSGDFQKWPAIISFSANRK